MTAIAFISHRACLDHAMGASHPEAPERLRAITHHLANSGFGDSLRWEQPREPHRAYWANVHAQALVERLERESPAQGLTWLDADTALNPHSLNAAAFASAAVLHGIDLVASGEITAAFCAIRPPGHHAEFAQPMGFCLVNQAAVAVHYLRQHLGVQRVAILDFDVHHGNGTFDIFKDDPATLVCSSYQHPFYPGRQLGIVRNHLIYSPLAAGTKGSRVLAEMESRWLPALAAHKPQWIIFSAGFDAHVSDPLGGLCWQVDDYLSITQLLLSFDGGASCPVLSLLEGGYNLEMLGACVQAHLEGLNER